MPNSSFNIDQYLITKEQLDSLIVNQKELLQHKSDRLLATEAKLIDTSNPIIKTMLEVNIKDYNKQIAKLSLLISQLEVIANG